MIRLKVGDLVRFYGHCITNIGYSDNYYGVGDLTLEVVGFGDFPKRMLEISRPFNGSTQFVILLDGGERLAVHPNQCRKVRKTARRKLWVLIDPRYDNVETSNQYNVHFAYNEDDKDNAIKEFESCFLPQGGRIAQFIEMDET